MHTVGRWIAAAAVAGGLCGVARASEAGDASLRASRWEGTGVPGLTLGIEKERFYRNVRFDSRNARKIEAEIHSVYFGYPLAPWLRLFGAAGLAQVKLAGRNEWSDAVLRARAGVGLHLWRIEIPAPEFMAGAVSVRAAADAGVAAYDQGGESCRWQEYSAAVTVHYELLAEQRPGHDALPYSLDLYAGPLLQFVHGRRHFEGVERSFDEHRAAGLAAGANLFLTPALSIGAHLQFFDTFSWRAAIRYAF